MINFGLFLNINKNNSIKFHFDRITINIFKIDIYFISLYN